MMQPPFHESGAVSTLAHNADLPLAADRIEPVAQILFAWLDSANALSRKMSASAYAELTPITGFVQTVQHGETTA